MPEQRTMAKQTVKKAGKNPGPAVKKQKDWGPRTWAQIVTLSEVALEALDAGNETKAREALRGIRSLAQPTV